jgi:hypothetical protein
MDAPQSLAPSASRSAVPLLLIGLATTALALFGVWGINQATDNFNIMGFYLYYILPVGAIVVGIAAGSGFGFGSWKTGVRISRGLLWTVVALLVAAYVTAQYIEYSYLKDSFGIEVGFLEFFDYATRQFSFREERGGMGDPLGAWGYAFRLLELGGFVLGGLVVPLTLRSKSYCDRCQVYMRSRQLLLLPAGAAPRKLKKKDLEGQAAYAQETEQAYNEGMLALEHLQQHAESGRSTEFMKILDQHQPQQKVYGKLASRISVHLDACPACHQGLLRATQITGQGNQIRSQALGQSPVTPALVQDLKA